MDSDEEIEQSPEDFNLHEVTSRYDVTIDETKIPQAFRHLVEYAKYWAIGDDVERSRLMGLTLEKELQTFVDAAWPLRDEIDAWCRSHDDLRLIPDEAVLFDMMMNALAEAETCHIGLDYDNPELFEDAGEG